VSIFFKICRDFFKKMNFYVAFCAYRLRPIRDTATDSSQYPLSRQERPRLWTMLQKTNLRSF